MHFTVYFSGNSGMYLKRWYLPASLLCRRHPPAEPEVFFIVRDRIKKIE